VCEATQGEKAAYDYGPAGFDYTRQGLEPQAQIVSDWYAKHANIEDVKRNDFTSLQRPQAVHDAYYRYIVENLRVGRF